MVNRYTKQGENKAGLRLHLGQNGLPLQAHGAFWPVNGRNDAACIKARGETAEPDRYRLRSVLKTAIIESWRMSTELNATAWLFQKLR